MTVPGDPFSWLLWNIGYTICHQLPERSLFIGGYQLPMCARDTGLYLGFVVVAAYYWAFGLRRRGGMPDRYVLAVSIIGPAWYALDAGGSYLGMIETNNNLRLASGLAFGLSVGILLFAVSSMMTFKGDRKVRAFKLTDLPPIYLLTALVFVLLIALDLGIAGYYAISMLICLGYLLFFFVLLSLIWGAVRDWSWVQLQERRFLFEATLVTEVVVVGGLGLAHWVLYAALLP